MTMIDDLRAKLVTAESAVDAAKGGEDIDAILRAVDGVDRARAALHEEVVRITRALGKLAEIEARKASAGAYAVEFMNLCEMLPDAAPAALPGAGVVVVRSHTTASKKEWDADVGVAKGRAMADIMADLTCANIVRIGNKAPGADGKWDEAIGLAFRNFLESDLGSGMANQLGAKILALGGARADEAKRASK